MMDSISKQVRKYRLTKDRRAGSRFLYYNLNIKSSYNIGVTKFEGLMSTYGLTLLPLRIHDEHIAVSWNGEYFNRQKNLFYLEFIAIENGILSNSLDINSTITKAEAYQVSQVLNINLKFKADQESVIQLFQNTPNPFLDLSFIKFILPESANIDLRFFDISGKQVHSFTGFYEKGQHEIKLTKEYFNFSGILYYKLRVGEFKSDTYKIVVIN